MDDIWISKYIDDTYILSQNRWGTWLLYQLIGIHDFTPFWLEFAVTLILFATAILASAMIKSIAKEKIPNFAYIIFSSVFISSPVIEYFYVFQSTNISVALSNLALMLIVYFAYKNYFNKGNFRNYIILGVIASIFIAMYESDVQTFIEWTLILLLIHIKFENSKLDFKEVIKCGLCCALVLTIGIVFYAIIGTAIKAYLNHIGTLTENYAYHETIFATGEAGLYIINKLNLLIKYEKSNFMFCIIKYASIIILIIGIIESIRKNTLKNFLLIIGIILSNLILYFCLNYILYRMYYSWSVFVAFEIMYIYLFFTEAINTKIEKHGKLKYIQYCIMIACSLIIIYQSKILNNNFYKDYRIAENSQKIAVLIGNTITTECENYKGKMVVFLEPTSTKKAALDINLGLDALTWSYNAFDTLGVETTKYINYFGYDLVNAEQEVYEEKLYLEDYQNSTKINNIVYEGEKYIYVNLEYCGISD